MYTMRFVFVSGTPNRPAGPYTVTLTGPDHATLQRGINNQLICFRINNKTPRVLYWCEKSPDFKRTARVTPDRVIATQAVPSDEHAFPAHAEKEPV